ncbi:MAG: spermidine synthase [Nitrososphaerota archaeon]|nr:spermidine synthase [Nitrososphaerota archaeon]
MLSQDFLVLGRISIEQLAPNYIHAYSFTKAICIERTKYQFVEVYEHPVFGKMLILDGKPQLSILDEQIYHEVLTHPAMLAHPDPRRIAILGGGDGGILREVLKHDSVDEVYLVDIDWRVVDICRRYLEEVSQGAFDDPRVKLVYMDAYRFIEEWNGEPFDIIIMDLTDPVSLISAGLYTYESFETISSKLSRVGIVSVQSESPTFSKYIFQVHFYNIAATIGSVFNHTVLARDYIPCFGSDWGFAYASNGEYLKRLNGESIDAELKERGVSTRYFTGQVFEAITRIPKVIVEEVARSKPVYVKDAEKYIEERAKKLRELRCLLGIEAQRF